MATIKKNWLQKSRDAVRVLKGRDSLEDESTIEEISCNVEPTGFWNRYCNKFYYNVNYDGRTYETTDFISGSQFPPMYYVINTEVLNNTFFVEDNRNYNDMYYYNHKQAVNYAEKFNNFKNANNLFTMVNGTFDGEKYYYTNPNKIITFDLDFNKSEEIVEPPLIGEHTYCTSENTGGDTQIANGMIAYHKFSHEETGHFYVMMCQYSGNYVTPVIYKYNKDFSSYDNEIYATLPSMAKPDLFSYPSNINTNLCGKMVIYKNHLLCNFSIICEQVNFYYPLKAAICDIDLTTGEVYRNVYSSYDPRPNYLLQKLRRQEILINKAISEANDYNIVFELPVGITSGNVKNIIYKLGSGDFSKEETYERSNYVSYLPLYKTLSMKITSNESDRYIYSVNGSLDEDEIRSDGYEEYTTSVENTFQVTIHPSSEYIISELTATNGIVNGNVITYEDDQYFTESEIHIVLEKDVPPIPVPDGTYIIKDIKFEFPNLKSYPSSTNSYIIRKTEDDKYVHSYLGSIRTNNQGETYFNIHTSLPEGNITEEIMVFNYYGFVPSSNIEFVVFNNYYVTDVDFANEIQYYKTHDGEIVSYTINMGEHVKDYNFTNAYPIINNPNVPSIFVSSDEYQVNFTLGAGYVLIGTAYNYNNETHANVEIENALNESSFIIPYPRYRWLKDLIINANAKEQSFIINLYKNTSENIEVSKNLIDVAVLDGNLRQSCSIINPVVTVYMEDVPTCNYAYIEKFNRYYYIDNIINVGNNLWSLSMRCDVLMSFKSDFINSDCFVTRAENSGSNLIKDPLLSTEPQLRIDIQTIYNDKIKINNLLTGLNIYVILSSIKRVDHISRNIFQKNGYDPLPNLPPFEIAKHTDTEDLVGMYGFIMNYETFCYLTKFLNDHNFQTLLISASLYPFELTQAAETTNWQTNIVDTAEVTYIQFPDNQALLPSDAHPMYIDINYFHGYYYYSDYESIDITIPKASSFIDYEAIYNLYIPFYGWTQLNTEEIVGHGLKIVYSLDFPSQMETVHVIDTTNNVLLLSEQCNLNIALSIGFDDSALIKTQRQSLNLNSTLATMNNIISATGSLAKGDLSGVVGLATVGVNELGQRLNTELQQKMLYTSNNSKISSGMIGIYSPLNLILKKTYRNIRSDVNTSLIGKPVNMYSNLHLWDNKGFIQASLTHISSSVATSQEKDEIEELLNKGVIL